MSFGVPRWRFCSWRGDLLRLHVRPGTRGWSVVIGFLLLLAVTVIAYKLKLRVVSWLLGKFFALSAFAILVIFQPELRRMLSELGNLRSFTPPGNSARTSRSSSRRWNGWRR